MPGLGLGLTIGGKGGGGLDTLYFALVSETDESATYRMDPALLVSEDDESATILIPEKNFTSQDAESVTVEA